MKNFEAIQWESMWLVPRKKKIRAVDVEIIARQGREPRGEGLITLRTIQSLIKIIDFLSSVLSRGKTRRNEMINPMERA